MSSTTSPSAAGGARPPRSSPRRREPSFGLPPWRRLRATRDVARVERQGLRASGAFVAVTVRPGPGRLGLVVSKKVDNRAVQRNRVKRLLRDIFRQEKPAWARRAQGAVDVVVAARPEAKGVSRAALRDDALAALATALQRLAGDKAGRSPRRP
jgi:ribonuclease P protein component